MDFPGSPSLNDVYTFGERSWIWNGSGWKLLKVSNTSITANSLLESIKSVDGPGSGLEADLLDGQHGSYYLDLANATGTLSANQIATLGPSKLESNTYNININGNVTGNLTGNWSGYASQHYAAALRANRNITGGGTISVSSANPTEITWSQRFLIMSNGRDSVFAPGGYYDITMPSVGTVIQGVGNAVNQTVNANGIPLLLWHALYYILPLGSGTTSLPGNFRLVNYQSDVIIPAEWVLIAVKNDDTGVIYFPNGIKLKSGQSLDQSTYDARSSQFLSGYTWSAPAAIGSTTANTGAFTTVSSGNTTITGFANVTTTLQVGGLATFNGNVSLGAADHLILSSTSGISANGTYGTAGQMLTSNGTTAYWSTPQIGDITSVTAGNGLTGGGTSGDVTLTVGAGNGVTVNTTTVAVLANSGITSNATGVFAKAANGISVDTSGINVTGGTGLVSNTTGVHVNSAYIATITVNSANNADYLDGQHGSYYAANSQLASYALLASPSFTGTLSAADVTISGNLTVSGTTTYINTQTLNVGDNIITLNADLPGATAPSENAGIEVNRGSSANVQFMWDETNDRWSTNGQPLAVSSIIASGSASGITTLAAGNTTITGFVNATSSVNAASLAVGTNFIANTTAVVATGYVNVASDSASIRIGNSTVFTTSNSTIYSGTALSANNADYLDGQHGSYYAANSQLASYALLSGATFTGAVTFNANVTLGDADHLILSSTSGISANGTYGTAGHVLHSNGSAAYWAADDQGVTSVATGNGLSGGTITATGTVSVLANTGIVANSTGLFVNASYINTISSNNAAYLGGYTWASPGAIGSTTSNTGAFTTITSKGNLSVDSAAVIGSGNGFFTSTGASSNSYIQLYDGSTDASMKFVVNFTDAGYRFFNGGTRLLQLNQANGAIFDTKLAAGNTTITGFISATSYGAFDYITTANNGNGTNLKVGDDAWFGDVNIADTVRLMGQQNANNGYIVFGNADNSIKLGRSGTGALTWNSAFTVTGTSTFANVAMANNYLIAPVLKAYSEDKTTNATTTGAVTLDLSTTNVFDLTLTGNTTLTFSNPPASTRVFSFSIIAKQDATGGRTITWPASKKFAGGVAPPATTTANAIDVWSVMTYDGGTSYIISLSVKDAK